MTAKLISTPRRTIFQSETRGRSDFAVIVGAAPLRTLHQKIAPFDIRSLGLQFWNRDSSVLDFEPVLKTWTNARLEEVTRESDHIYRIKLSSSRHNALVRTLWVDDSRGFGPIRCEVGSRSGLPMYVSEMVWVQIHGTWIPKKYRNEMTTASLTDTYDLSFKWELVNKPVPPSLFTVAGLERDR